MSIRCAAMLDSAGRVLRMLTSRSCMTAWNLRIERRPARTSCMATAWPWSQDVASSGPHKLPGACMPGWKAAEHARPSIHLLPDLVLAQRVPVEGIGLSHGGRGGLYGVPAVIARQSARRAHVAPKAHAACT